MQKGFVPILILVVVLLIAGVGGGAFYFGRLTAPKNNNTQTAVTSQTTPSASPVADETETAGWKVYQDSDGKYEFKYPSDWLLDKDDKKQKTSSLIYKDNNTEYSFLIWSFGRDGPLADEMKDDVITLGDRQYTRTVWINDNSTFFVVVNPYNFSLDGKHIEMELPPGKGEEYLKILNLILSSIRVLK